MDRIALVTGGASGIGQGIAHRLRPGRRGLVIADRAPEAKAAETIAGVRKHGRQVLFVQADVADEASVKRMAEAALARFGRVDILVNNAGIFTESLIENPGDRGLDRVMNVILRGVSSAPGRSSGRCSSGATGRIINIASQLGQIGGKSIGHYAASKAGVIGLTKSLAREVATRGVLVNAICPGPIETPLLESETEERRSAKLAELHHWPLRHGR